MRKKLIRYFLLFTGLLFLLSVTIPHHHHEDGRSCYKLNIEHTTQDRAEGEASHDCICNGHTIAFFFSNTGGVSNETDLLLFPIQTLFDQINPVAPAFTGALFLSTQAIYLESRHDIWIASASGLRAPPLL